ncbi:MAG: lipoyl protein ligase domain-containing protein [Acidimicrobiales bacterium]
MCDVVEQAVVLGSTQAETDVDLPRCRQLGISVVRRRSGGGAVLIGPQAQVWIDVFLPPDDPLSVRDVGQSFLWFGRSWATALGATLRQAGVDRGDGGAGVVSVTAPGGEPATRWSRTLCFGGLGAGEVTLDARKVVGISQRRDRSGSWLHSMAPLRDTSEELVACLALSDEDRSEALRWLRGYAGAVEVPAQSLVEAVIAALP